MLQVAPSCEPDLIISRGFEWRDRDTGTLVAVKEKVVYFNVYEIIVGVRGGET